MSKKRKSFFNVLLLSTFSLLAASTSEAKLIQILHTNDTHSFLNNTQHKNDLGGSARLKSLIDFYKNKATDDGVKTLVMDAGDFTEGNIYYMADQGRKAFEIHSEMGYDVGALGNHDYLMGSSELDKILGDLNFKLPLVVANLQIGSQFKNIKEKNCSLQRIHDRRSQNCGYGSDDE